jgi:hypothetical protein
MIWQLLNNLENCKEGSEHLMKGNRQTKEALEL